MRKILIALLPAASLALMPAAVQAAGEGALTGAASGAAGGAIVGGPIGAAVGGVIGAVVGSAIEAPPPPVVTYVEQQSVAPVDLQGNLVVGATLPPAVVLYPVPPDVYAGYDSGAYAYTIVNGRHVVVDPNTRVVVAVSG